MAPDRFLINPQGLHWSEITPSDIVMADGDGNVIEGKYEVEPTAFYIHARIHAGNPRAKVVLHTHMPYATALCCLQDFEFLMLDQNACRFHGRCGSGTADRRLRAVSTSDCSIGSGDTAEPCASSESRC